MRRLIRQGDVIAMASQRCRACRGYGVDQHGRICACGLRAIFRACLEYYHHCMRYAWAEAAGPKWWTRIDYAVDFVTTCGRYLRNDLERRIFHSYMLRRNNWRRCCQTLRITRGRFWRAVEKLETQLGRGLCEVSPYPLWPIYEYDQHWQNRPMGEWLCESNVYYLQHSEAGAFA